MELVEFVPQDVHTEQDETLHIRCDVPLYLQLSGSEAGDTALSGRGLLP